MVTQKVLTTLLRYLVVALMIQREWQYVAVNTVDERSAQPSNDGIETDVVFLEPCPDEGHTDKEDTADVSNLSDKSDISFSDSHSKSKKKKKAGNLTTTSR